MVSISQLPFDILENIIPLLRPIEFLAFTSTCKQFRSILDDPTYWKNATIDTFRVRNRPSTDNDGLLWRKLYRRLRTQTRVFMWGQGCPGGMPRPIELGTNGGPEPGIISDIQCGGWFTVFLNNRGELFLQGKMNGLVGNPRGMNHTFNKLKFPEDATETAQTAIRQFSTGRMHILGLADDGTVWLWNAAALPAKKIEFSRSDEDGDREKATVSQVVAGWTTSAVYIRGRGIVMSKYNATIYMNGADEVQLDNREFKWVPRSGYSTPKPKKAETPYGLKSLTTEEKQGEEDIDEPGEVVSFALLEHYMLFCTDKGRLFFHKPDTDVSLRIPGLGFVTDVQGQFQSFAIFQKDGVVITAKQALLDFITESDDAQADVVQTYFERIPALQNSEVIQIAIGDHHFHALHSNGRITSYGQDPRNSGALGLGSPEKESRLTARGNCIAHGDDNWQPDRILGRENLLTGRAVWFLPQQQAWADSITSAMNVAPAQVALAGRISEWVEQRGTGWDKDDADNQDGLGAYFALSVAAGGWRGGALVLVNQDLVEKHYACFEKFQNVPDFDQWLKEQYWP